MKRTGDNLAKARETRNKRRNWDDNPEYAAWVKTQKPVTFSEKNFKLLADKIESFDLRLYACKMLPFFLPGFGVKQLVTGAVALRNQQNALNRKKPTKQERIAALEEQVSILNPET